MSRKILENLGFCRFVFVVNLPTMPKKKRNLELPESVDTLLESEQQGGTSITKTISAALYWYFNRMDANQRELARMECGQWIQSGSVPSSTIATELEGALRAARERELRRLRRSS